MWGSAARGFLAWHQEPCPLTYLRLLAPIWGLLVPLGVIWCPCVVATWGSRALSLALVLVICRFQVQVRTRGRVTSWLCLWATPGLSQCWSWERGVGAAPCSGPCHGRKGGKILNPALHRAEPESRCKKVCLPSQKRPLGPGGRSLKGRGQGG